MAKVILGQIIASTALDAHGERLTKGQLEDFFVQTPERFLMNQQHDWSKPPVALAYNKRFEQLPNGEYAIKVDMEVFDEVTLGQYGGVSLAFTRRAGRYSARADREPEVVLSYNPRQFASDRVHQIVNDVGDSVAIDIEERAEKAVEPTVILLLKFVSQALAAKFLGEAAMGGFRILRQKIHNLAFSAPASGRTPRVQLIFEIPRSGGRTEVLIEISASDLAEEASLSVGSALLFVQGKVGDSAIARVAIRSISDSPRWEILYFITDDGELVELGGGDK